MGELVRRGFSWLRWHPFLAVTALFIVALVGYLLITTEDRLDSLFGYAIVLVVAIAGLGGIAWIVNRIWGNEYRDFFDGFRRQKRRRLTLDDLWRLTPTEFEHFCAEAMRTHGYTSVKVTGGSGDLQADIIARDPAGRKTIAQCKRFQEGDSVGSPDLQKLIGMNAVKHDANVCLFFTTSRFTEDAVKLADDINREHAGKIAIELYAGEDVVEFAARVRWPLEGDE